MSQTDKYFLTEGFSWKNSSNDLNLEETFLKEAEDAREDYEYDDELVSYIMYEKGTLYPTPDKDVFFETNPESIAMRKLPVEFYPFLEVYLTAEQDEETFDETGEIEHQIFVGVNISQPKLNAFMLDRSTDDLKDELFKGYKVKRAFHQEKTDQDFREKLYYEYLEPAQEALELILSGNEVSLFENIKEICIDAELAD